MPNITLTGNLYVQLQAEARPAPIPLSFSFDYTEKSVIDYAWASTQTNLALLQGTVTAPKFIYIEVTEGTVTLSTSAQGAGATTFAASATPGLTPACGFVFSQVPATAQFYASTTGPARAKIWFFE